MKSVSFPSIVLSALLWSVAGFAQQQLPADVQQLKPGWIVEEITDSSVPEEIVREKRKAAANNGLPDGRVATGEGDIAAAWYSEPTERYAHGVLGDAIEGGALRVTNNRGENYTFRLPRTEVFEDITPRLADLDRDGRTEVITILSSVSEGASVAVFGLNGNALIKKAQTPYIGSVNRWLNIAGIDHFGGNRRPDIAIVVTPHLSGILQFYRYRNGGLKRIAAGTGFSNHVAGSSELRLSAVADINGNGVPDLAVPSLARDELVIIGIRQTGFVELHRIKLPAQINRAIGVAEKDGKTGFVAGLEDGKIYSVHRK